MKFAVLVFSAAVLAAGVARADVIPPPQEITEVQQVMVGAWQQQVATGMMGHGEGVEMLAFDKTRFGSILMFALPPSAMYQANSRRGTWTGERVSPNEIKVTMTWEDGGEPDVRTFKSIDEKTLEVQQEQRFGMVTITYKRVYP